ncbi:MAG: molybdopterin-dependent oxidoreductase [Actinomycetota bacterium]
MSDIAAAADRTVFRTCPLCEATCGLEIEIRGGEVKRIRGDRDDVFSKGFVCPKGSTLGKLYDDPDRLRKPVVRRGVDDDGAPVFVEVEWDEAFAVVAEKLRAVRSEHGNESVGVYLGNPNAHNLAWNTHARVFLQALGTRSMFSASTVDQMPRHVASGYLYGNGMRMPVPDLDRTDLLVLLGTNPFVSNGSICTAPDYPGRIKAVRSRGGRVVVIDPSRTRTAEEADQHITIRPGTDAVLLAAIAHRLISTDQVSMGRVAGLVDGLEELRDAIEPFSPEYAETVTGVDAAVIMGLADDIAGAPTAAVHGRIGTTTVEFGTLTTWLIDVIAILTGNLDEPGGSMFPRSAVERVRPHRAGRAYRVGRWTSRVNANPEVQGELPAADLPIEILEPGDGQLKMMFTVAGNPVLSCPDAAQMDDAFASLEAMVSVDIYLNETTRHADVILPPASALEKSHFDIAFSNLSVRNIANYSPPVFESEQPAEDDIVARIALIASGLDDDGAGDPTVVHDQIVNQLLSGEALAAGSPVEGRDVDELLALVDGDTGSDRVLDVMVRTGPYGDGFGSTPDGLSLERLRNEPHGVDLGALEPRLPDALQTEHGRIDLWHGPFLDELARLEARAVEWAGDGRLRLIGRRHLRSNNSWMHNVEVLVKGKPRCTLQINPNDAAELGIVDGGQAAIRSRVGEVIADVDVTDIVMPGVVSLPHGWGHGQSGARLEVAARHAGVNSNVLTDPLAIDPMSGTSVLNGIPVEVTPA